MRRGTIALLIFATMLSLSGCQRLGIYTQTDIDEKNDQMPELEQQLQSSKEISDELNSRLSDLQSASEDLQTNFDRLQSENWNDVMPESRVYRKRLNQLKSKHYLPQMTFFQP